MSRTFLSRYIFIPEVAISALDLFTLFSLISHYTVGKVSHRQTVTFKQLTSKHSNLVANSSCGGIPLQAIRNMNYSL